MSEGHFDFSHHKGTYLKVFGALMVLTAVTVAIAQVHLTVGLAVTLALFVASVKGTLVASYFMHLIDERRAIYQILILTGVFFVTCLFLPLGAFSDQSGEKQAFVQVIPQAAEHSEAHH